jgi:hypothetical protein
MPSATLLKAVIGIIRPFVGTRWHAAYARSICL